MSAEHRIRWYVYAGGERIPRTSSMRGSWGYDATCSCGWDSRTGGAVESYVRRQVADHKWDAAHPLTAECRSCGEPIQHVGGVWSHVGSGVVPCAELGLGYARPSVAALLAAVRA
jgi:hypothetical protein